MRVDIWFHPGCPWAWVTSRWLLEVAPQRDLEINWRSYSLTLLNGCADVPPQYRARAEGAHDILRVVEAARAGDQPQEAIGALYTAAGQELFAGTWPLDVADMLARAGLPPGLADAFADRRWDQAIEASMLEAERLAGSTAASPTIAVGSEPRRAFFGPVLARVPEGPGALELWDAFATLAAHGALYELKRDRAEGLQLPEG